jgi:hypothetical protein
MQHDFVDPPVNDESFVLPGLLLRSLGIARALLIRIGFWRILLGRGWRFCRRNLRRKRISGRGILCTCLENKQVKEEDSS